MADQEAFKSAPKIARDAPVAADGDTDMSDAAPAQAHVKTSEEIFADISGTAGDTAAQAAISGQGSAGGKTCAEILAWVKSLPTTVIPEAVQAEICAAVQNQNMSGAVFTEKIANTDRPGLGCPSPAHWSKLVKAWKNVMAEDAVREQARANLAANQLVKGKGEMVTV